MTHLLAIFLEVVGDPINRPVSAQAERRGGAGPGGGRLGRPSPAACCSRPSPGYKRARFPNTSSSLVEASLAKIRVSTSAQDAPPGVRYTSPPTPSPALPPTRADPPVAAFPLT